ncbi:hypothetical protein EST38_g9175 [Candolleomyces aberdarensis]|uniref:Uncharacterized protein n=1 Tax=Candolleomyces aberdarensis TaxID=2316362 RepID=A0A4Q2DAM8_9AGAR|nr:hypothetical protein EST38_g9175 [Candolleomyces aberdarensis]
MAKGSARRRTADRQTPRSSGGPSGDGLTAEERLSKCFEEIDAAAEQGKKSEREAQGTSYFFTILFLCSMVTPVVTRESSVWDENYSCEEQATGQSDASIGSPLKCSTPHSNSVSKLFNAIAGPAETPWSLQLRNLFDADEICPPNNASRAPLLEMTNLDAERPSHYPGASITPPALPRSQQDTSEDKQLKQFRQYGGLFYERFHPSSPLPQQDSAFAPQDSTNTTNTQETGSFVIDLDEDDLYENDVGVYYGANGEDSDGDALSVPESLPAETPTTSSEFISPYPSEPQDSPASSPPAEVAGTQSGPSEASSLKESQQASAPAADVTETQSSPSEGASAPTVATEEQASTGKKTTSRKRRLSESEDQPNKRPASESKMQSTAVTTQASLAPATPSPAPLPVVDVASNPAAVESAAPSRTSSAGPHRQEASETTTNATPAVSDDAVSHTTTGPPPARQTLVSPDSHHAGANANVSDIVQVPRSAFQLPERTPSSPAANEGIDRRGAQEATSVSGGVFIRTPAAPPLAQPIPVNANRRGTNAVIPSNVPTGLPFVWSPMAPSPNFEAPAPRVRNQKQATGKNGASTRSKVGRGAGSKKQAQMTDPPPPLGGAMHMIIFNDDTAAELALPTINTSGSAELSGSTTSDDTYEKRKIASAFVLYLEDTKQCGAKSSAAWAALPPDEKQKYYDQVARLTMEEAQRAMAHRNRQAALASHTPSPAASVQSVQAQTNGESFSGPSTAPITSPAQFVRDEPGGGQQQQPQAQEMPPMERFAPAPAPFNGYPAAHYPTVGGHQQLPANPHQTSYMAPPVFFPMQGMPMVPPPYNWTHAHPGFGMPPHVVQPHPHQQPLHAPYFMNQPPPTTNHAHYDNANANAGPSVPVTNANGPFNPLPQGSFNYYQAAAMNANAAAGPSMPPAANNVPYPQDPRSWGPTPWYPHHPGGYPGNEGPAGVNWSGDHPPQPE